jgi:succinate dehydrogenase / fumarate reductase flavoprotein subunit
MPGIAATDPAGKRREAEEWCDRFEENTRKWLKSTIARHGADGHPQISYEDIDTSLIPPRPRLYGLVGGDVIEEVWKERSHKASANGTATRPGAPVAAGV